MNTDTSKVYSLAEAKNKLAEELRSLHVANRLLFNQTFISRVEVNVENIDPLLWLNAQDNSIKIFWEDRNQTCTVAAIGSTDTLIANHGEEYGSFVTKMEKRLSDKFPTMRYYGGFCFNPNYPPQADWQHWRLAQFVLPLIELRKTSQGTTLACNIRVAKDFKSDIEHACRVLVNLDHSVTGYTSVLLKPYREINFPDEATWKASAAYIINAITEKKYEKLVLARAVRLDFKDPINPFLLMTRLRETVSNCFSFIFQFQKGEYFLGTSPERLYHRKGQDIATEALAGTRPRSETNDTQLQNELLSSTKDRAEQNYVVEMIYKNLTPLCTQLKYDDEPSLLKWSVGHHLITRFEGKLKNGIGDAALVTNLHPTPAVAGTPTKAALKDLPYIEKFDRGWYCGPVGYLSPQESELSVAIRSALIHERNLYLFAGAGIIKESLPQAEWEETESKLSNFFKIFDVNQS